MGDESGYVEIPGLIAIGFDVQTALLSGSELAALFQTTPTRAVSVGDPVSRSRQDGPKHQVTTIAWEVEPSVGEELDSVVHRAVGLAHRLATTCRPLPRDACLRLLVGMDPDIRAIWLEPDAMALLAEAGVTFEVWVSDPDRA